MKPLPKLLPGYRRDYCACKQCGLALYYDYVPYSLSNPIWVLPCGHGLTLRFNEATRAITEREFINYKDRNNKEMG